MNKVALITGGNGGIGREILKGFSARGIDIVNLEKSGSGVDGLLQPGTRGLAVNADITRDDEVKKAVAQIISEFGRLDILVNCAGVSMLIPFDDLDAVTDEVWDEIFEINTKAVFYMIRACAPALARTKGSIINIASIAALSGKGSSIPYCASKAAVISLTKSFAHALAPDVRVNAVAPGPTRTRMIEGKDELVAKLLSETPLGRIANPSDIADAVVGLACDLNFVTGQTLPVDGGYRIG